MHVKSWSLLACAALSSACLSTNQSGDLETTKTGDLSAPLAHRRAPDDEEVERCGSGAPMSGSRLHRAPYLQQVSSSGVHVLWTAEAGAPDQVSLWQPDDPAVERSSPAPTSVMEDSAPAPGIEQYRGELASLSPDTLYCYSLGVEGTGAAEPAGFRTAPAPGTGAKVAFAAFGDSGDGSSDQTAVLEQLETVPFRFMIHTGDIAYDNGSMSEFETNYFDVYATLSRSFAMFPSLGNHDDSSVFGKVYDLPSAGGKHWYSFDYGDVHFVALDTNEIGPEQIGWLEKDLSANQQPWTVVYGHHPPFSSGDHGSDMTMRSTMVPIFEKHHVDLVLSGHDHHYERIKPQNGVSYLVTGGGGRGTRGTGKSSFTAFSESVLHFVYVEVQGDELLLHAIDAAGTEFDQLAIHH